ncbi:MAG: tyrosine recombinase XerC [Clostridia bacterium]|nr:tyrosine recombinase XerC [Clostridia bacterium]
MNYPDYVEDYLTYMESILGKSEKTVKEYAYDIRLFLRFMKVRRRLVSDSVPFDEIDISDCNTALIRSVTKTDLYAYINFLHKSRDAGSANRARKVSSLRSFFKYIFKNTNLLKENPAADLESPKRQKSLPKYLTLNESVDLLKSVSGPYKERDFCILVLFLNCGMRLSELVGINIHDIREDTLVVTGKGNKQRTIYLNNACLSAIDNYLAVRPKLDESNKDRDALFLSNREKRISPKTVEYTVKKYIKTAALDPKKYSAHKLRHTAATLMYTEGNVDIRSLQEILGHESVATTEIYTHINNPKLKDAVNKNPLADVTQEDIETRKNKEDMSGSEE